jgi:hypothetical protein
VAAGAASHSPGRSCPAGSSCPCTRLRTLPSVPPPLPPQALPAGAGAGVGAAAAAAEAHMRFMQQPGMPPLTPEEEKQHRQQRRQRRRTAPSRGMKAVVSRLDFMDLDSGSGSGGQTNDTGTGHSHNTRVATSCFCAPAGGLSEGQSSPTPPRAYLCSVEGPSVPAGSQFLGVAPASV